jgi:uncharacterized protein
MDRPLMPKATAVWLVESTTLTFEQIGDFCGLHPLEVQAIADGEVAQGIVGQNPVASGQLTQAELDRCLKDPNARLKLSKPIVALPKVTGKGGKYTPVSRRGDRPDAIAWLVRNHPELTDAQIVKLVGTTKHTIAQVRDRTHWNSSNIKPRDPVQLGLCSQIDLDNAVALGQRRTQRETEAAKKGGKAQQPEPAKAEAEAAEGDTEESHAA